MVSPKYWKFVVFLVVNVWTDRTCGGSDGYGLYSHSPHVHLKSSGIIPPVLTSFNEDQSVNFDIIPQYAKYLSDQGITSFCVAGPSSEGLSLSQADRKRLVYEWSKAKKHTRLQHMTVVVGGIPIADTLDMAHYSESLGADNLFVLPDMMHKPKTIDDAIKYLLLVQQAAPNTALIYYYLPDVYGETVNIVDLVKQANKRVRNFRGVYYSSLNLPEALKVKRELKEGSRLFITNARLLSAARINGIDSYVGTEYSVFPEISLQILQAVDKSDVSRAMELQHRLTGVLEDITKEGAFLPTVKAAFESVTGFKVGPATEVLPRVSPYGKEHITTSLLKWGFSLAGYSSYSPRLWN